jgi:phosphoglycerate transporter family protein
VASIFWGSTVTVLVVSAIVGLICLEFVAFFEERNLRADRECSAAQEEA